MNVVMSLGSTALAGGVSQQVALGDLLPHSSAALGGTAYGGTSSFIYWATCPTFIRGGAAPTVLTTGVDQAVPSNTVVRIDGLKTTDVLSIACIVGTGTAYITPV